MSGSQPLDTSTLLKTLAVVDITLLMTISYETLAPATHLIITSFLRQQAGVVNTTPQVTKQLPVIILIDIMLYMAIVK